MEITFLKKHPETPEKWGPRSRPPLLLRHSEHKTTDIWCPFHYASFLELETQLRRDFHINFLSECFPEKTPQATNLTVIAIYLFSRLNMQKHTRTHTHTFSFPSDQMFWWVRYLAGNQAEGDVHVRRVIL